MKYQAGVALGLFVLFVSCGVGTTTPQKVTQARAAASASTGASSADAAANGNGYLALSPNEAPWLTTNGNHIVRADGSIWAGRGLSVHDTRNCEACTFNAPDLAESERRIDAAVHDWHADFVRLLMESYPTSKGRVQWQSVLDDPNYLRDIVNLVRYIGTNPNTYVLLSLWVDPSLDPNTGWPTGATADTWSQLASMFLHDSHVMFAVANEPVGNLDGADDAKVWTAMNNVVAAIRKVEDDAGTPHHLVSVQATRSYGRYLDYYINHPITAGNQGDNVLYETHVYDPADEFERILVQPAQKLPVLVAEYGPVNQPGVANMTMSDCQSLQSITEALHIPSIAWTFHQNCGVVSLLQETTDGCGVGMALTPSDWGTELKARLAKPAN